MKIKKNTVEKIIETLDAVLLQMDHHETNSQHFLQQIIVYHKKSAQNLVNYISF